MLHKNVVSELFDTSKGVVYNTLGYLRRGYHGILQAKEMNTACTDFNALHPTGGGWRIAEECTRRFIEG